MKALMDAPKEIGDTGPGYNWRDHTPTKRNDILELLRSNEMVGMATKKKYSRDDGMCVQVGAWFNVAGGVEQMGKGGSELVD